MQSKPTRTGHVAGQRIQQLLLNADQCVKCGLCLPHCPTYAEMRNEADGPRGRIALIQGIALGELEANDRLIAHLDGCLMCRACEVACPAKVRYGEIMDLGRAEIAARRPPDRPTRWLLALARGRRRQRALAWALFVYQRSGLRELARRSGIVRRLGLSRMESLAPTLDRPRGLRRLYPAVGETRGRVGLFIGCIGAVFDRRAIDAAVELLTGIGFEVQVPSAQTCCGALAQHAGMADDAAALTRRNVAAFGEVDAIVHLASGCGAQLAEDAPLQAGAAAGFRDRLWTAEAFLVAHWPPGLVVDPLPAHALVHEPCTLRNVLKQQQPVYRLLALIPGLRVEPLPDNARCCGAAGSHVVTQPELADRLRQPKLAAAKRGGARYLISSNIGCLLHLAAGLREDAAAPTVLHPVELLARQCSRSKWRATT